jgi:hypothetical protein
MKLAAALAVLAIGAALASAYPTSLAGIFRELNEGNTCHGDVSRCAFTSAPRTYCDG